MTSAEVLQWIDNQIGVNYDDFSNVDKTINKWVDVAKEKSDGDEYKGFEAALHKGIRDRYIDPMKELFDKIEASKTQSEIDNLRNKVSSVRKQFREPLQSGLERKEESIQFVSFRTELKQSKTEAQLLAITVPENISVKSQRSFNVSKGIRLSRIRIQEKVAARVRKGDIWLISQQLTGQVLDEIQDANTIRQLNRIDINDIPTKSGQRLARRALRERRKEIRE